MKWNEMLLATQGIWYGIFYAVYGLHERWYICEVSESLWKIMVKWIIIPEQVQRFFSLPVSIVNSWTFSSSLLSNASRKGCTRNPYYRQGKFITRIRWHYNISERCIDPLYNAKFELYQSMAKVWLMGIYQIPIKEEVDPAVFKIREVSWWVIWNDSKI